MKPIISIRNVLLVLALTTAVVVLFVWGMRGRLSPEPAPSSSQSLTIGTDARSSPPGVPSTVAAGSNPQPVASIQSGDDARRREKPGFKDVREGREQARGQSADRVQALAALRKEVPGVQVEFDPVTGAPSYVQATGEFLTGPAPNGKSPREVVEDYIDQNKALFGHDASALHSARVTREDVTQHNGVTTLVWNQEVNGIPVFKTILKANLTGDGRIVTIDDHFAASPVANRAEPAVNAERAVSLAAASLNDVVRESDVRATSKPDGAELVTRYAAPGQSDTSAQLTYLPMSASDMRLGWDVTTTSLAQNEMFRMVVDAENGEVLYRASLTADISNATYRIFTSESPTPFSPGHEFPSNLQPGYVSRVLHTTQAFDTTASPNGWIDDGNQETNGNNVDAHTDTDANNSPDLPRPNGGGTRTFDFPMDFTLAPSTYKEASVTQLFYWCNFMHDRMYQMGFTESAGNFQVNNFGRGGVGNDPVQADAQDGSGTDNANFSTPADGSSGRMQMYLWTGPNPDRDGSFEAEVVLHEYGHGVSNRLVGGGVGISALSTQGMGEGWSDFLGLALTAEASDNPYGNWARGGYSRFQSTSWYTENYYYGARRYSYSVDMLKNPHTLKDIDNTQVDWHTSVPRNPTYAATQDATQVHYQGTVWCSMLWDMRANLIMKHGFATGNDRAIRLVIDGMKLSPVNPNFVQARDGIIQATLVSFPGDLGEVWTAFAKRGAGFGATAPASSTTTGIVESYLVNDSLQINDRSGWSVIGDKGGPFTPTSKVLTLSNNGASAVNWSVATNASWLSASPASGTISPGGNVAVTITAQADAMAPGFFAANVTFTNTGTSFNQPVGVRLYVMPPRVHYFDLSSDPGWTRAGEWAFGTPTGSGGTLSGGVGNPDPTSGKTGTNVFGVNLSGNHTTSVTGPHYLTLGPVSLSIYTKTRLRFQRWLNTNALANTRTSVEISTDGTNWKDVYAAGGTAVTDSAWKQMDYDISRVADQQSTVYIRWGYQTISAPGAYSGWNIDDIELLGEATNTLAIASANSATEGDGPVTATLTMSLALPTDTTVTLTSSDPTAATVPSSVTILANETSTTFQITPVDDAVEDGPQTTLITASASGIGSGTKSFTVQDNETATLTLSLPASVTEGGAAGTGTVTRSVVNASPVTVTLVSSNLLAATVPDTVVIPANQASVNFAISAVNDNAIDGTQSTTISASVTGWTGASGSVDVLDNENLNLTVTMPASITEAATGTGSVAISGTLTSALTVNLSTNTPKLTVPASVTIPAGSISVSFTTTAPNDSLAEANVAASISASASGFNNGTGTTSVIDNDLHHFAFGTISSPKTLNSPFSITITAQNFSNSTVTSFTGTVSLSGTGTSGTITMTPTTTGAFSAGVRTETINISTATTNIVLAANDGAGHTGTSNSFTVGTGSLHHFAFSNITSPKTAGTAFSTTITAQDIANNTVSSFVSTATLSAPATRTVGTGTGTSFVPLNTGWHDQRSQCIYLQGEIGGASTIRGLQLNVTTVPGQTMNNFTIRLKHTALSSYATNSWESTGWTTVYQANETISATGLRTFTFTTPFNYDGTNNLMVDFSFNNSSWTTQGSVTFTTATANRTIYYATDSGFGDPLTWSGTTSPTPTATTILPNLVLQTGGTQTVSPSATGTFTSGVWTGNVTLNQATSQVALQALNGTTVRGYSNDFSVTSTVTANAQSIGVSTNTATAITLTGQDSANPGATLTYAVVTNPTNGTLSGTAPNLTYTPNTSFMGADSFTFTTANGAITSLPATVTITVAAGQEIVVEQPLGTGLTDGVSTIDYGTIPVGVGTVKTFTVKNTGALNLVVSSITKDGTSSGDVTIGSITSSTISGGASATFDVTFNPAASGARTAAIHVLSNDLDEGSFDIALTATSTSSIPDIAIEQPTGTDLVDSGAIISFGDTTLGTPVVRTFTVRNTGAEVLNIGTISFDGAGAAEFSAGAPVVTTLAPAGSTTFTAIFQPGSQGAKLAAMHVQSSDPDESPFDIAVHGICSAPIGPISLARDINPTGSASITSAPVAFGTTTYFAASSPDAGTELWKSDGTPAGTVRVSDIASGAVSSSPSNLTMLGSTLYFGANTTGSGVATGLYKSDGTTAGTTLVKTINSSGASMSGFTVVGSTLFFAASDSTTNGIELWKSDGTSAGTVMVKDISPGTGSSSPTSLTNFNGTLYFAATDGTNGIELWRSDGTSAGTVMVSNINTTAGASSSPATFLVIGTNLYFSATNGTTGIELYKTDGTTTAIVLDINSGSASSSPTVLTNVNGTLFFRATTATAGAELWKSDGTTAGTVLVKDIFVGTTSSTPNNLTAIGSTVYFAALDSTANGTELWKSDGTSAGTVLVKNINATANGSSSPASLTVVGSLIYFSASDGVSGAELWKSDGTTAGTVRVKDIAPGAAGSSIISILNAGGTVYLVANDGVTGQELWRTDGTVAGTFMLKDANPGTASSGPNNFIAMGGLLYFSATDGVNGIELWRSDGSLAGTTMVKDINAFAGGSSSPTNLTLSGSTLYFSANDGSTGVELWKSDGTNAGTVMVLNINPTGGTSSSPANLRLLGSTLLFSATDTTANGSELWRSDGTAGGTVLVKNINPTANAGSGITNAVVAGTSLFFSATDGTNGQELWISDGTAAGTVMVKDINTTAAGASSSPTLVTAAGSSVYFGANDGVSGSELWKSDGTAAGTVLVKDINPGSATGLVGNQPAVWGGRLYFSGNEGVNGNELWVSDGTTAGTFMLKDLNPGSASSSPSTFVEYNGLLYFSATDSFGAELWRTDGTASGTFMVKDINAGSSSSSPGTLVSASGFLFFRASTAAYGSELWRTDGTAGGTLLVSDLATGTAGSSPFFMTQAGSRLYFNASAGDLVAELWSLDLGAAPELAVYEGTGTAGPERQDNVGTYSFGTQSAATARSFTLKNTGAGHLYVSDITLSGANAGSFVVLSKPDSALPIPPGATHTFTVTATLEGPVTQSAVFSILCNDADEASFDVPITVTVDDTVAPVISAPATYLVGQPGQLAMSLPDVRGIVAYTDNRPGDGIITQDPIPGDIVLAIGQTVNVTFVASDSAGNVSNTVVTTVQMGLGQPNTGRVAWARSGSGVGAEGTVSRVVATSDGGAVVAGAFGSSPFTLGAGADQVTLTSVGANDVFVAKFARDGTLEWARSGGGSTTDAVSGLLELGDGSIVVAGTFSGSATFSGTVMSGGGGTDSFVVRYLADGTLSWAKGWGGTGTDSVTQLVKLADGNVAIAGSYSTTATITLVTGVTLANIGTANTDLFLVKYNSSNGNALWAKSFGSSVTSESSTGLNLAALPDGGVAIAGGVLSATMSMTGTATTIVNGGAAATADWFAAKFDTSGTLQWARNVGGGTGSETPSANSLQVFSNGDLALAGAFTSSGATFGVGSPSPQTFTSIGGNDVAVIRLSGATGLQTWAKRAGGTSTDSVAGILVLPDNSVAVTGLFANGSIQLGINEVGQTTLTAPTTSNKAFLALLGGGDGSLRWAKATGGLAVDSVFGLAPLGGGDLGLAGTFTTPSDVFGPGEPAQTTLTNVGTGADVFVAKFSRVDGSLVWATRGGGANTETVHAFTGLQNGSAMVVGTFQPPSATFGLGEPGETTLINADTAGTNTDLFFARFHGGGVEAPVAPLVSLLAPSGQSSSTLTFSASIDSRGQDTTVTVEYGPTTSYGSTVTLPPVFAGLITETRSLNLTGLAPLTTLNFRVVATNPAGTTTSANQVISTFADAEIVVEQPDGNGLTDGSSTVSFGTVAIGGSSTKTFTIRNTGTVGTLSGLALSKDGAAAADYAVGTLSVTSLAPGDSTTFTVTYTPGAGGVRTAALHIASNDGDENPFDIALTGDNLLDATFNTSSAIPITTAGYAVPVGRSLNLTLGFAPTPGTVLTVVNNTGAALISGAFVGLPQGGIITAVFGGQTYAFQANYYGGDGNDLVLLESFDWTWTKGSSTTTTTATNGTQGTPAAANTPNGHSNSMTWTGNDGTLWVFGGFNASAVIINELWRYQPSTSQWTWMKGTSATSVFGVYGTLGAPDPANTPGSRSSGVTWVDAAGKLWLFGGSGNNASANGLLNDLWNYDPATNNWTWMGGGTGVNSFGTYGTQGVPSTGNIPGPRQNANAWIDASGNVYLWGGNGYGGSGIVGSLNDLWKFDPVAGTWTWLKGSSTTTGSSASYGTKGVAAATNTPGGRSGATNWIDSQGRLWLFGGNGNGTGLVGPLGDLWRYEPATNNWTWMSGSGAVGFNNGSFGTKGVASINNVPSYRQGAAGWTGRDGRLWLLGGNAFAVSGGSQAEINDLWCYDPATNEWMWLKGPNQGQNNGVYGTLGVPAVTNQPGARQLISTGSSFAGNRASGDLWLFGGTGYAGTGTTTARLNDVWMLDLPNLPSVTTLAASSVLFNAATGNASVTANGIASSVRIRYGTDSTLAVSNVTAWQSAGSSTAPASAAVPVSGLVGGTTYYFRAEVFNNAGVANGAILNFTTAPPPDIAIEQPAGSPLVDGSATVDIGSAGVAASVSKTFTLKNTGSVSTLTISGSTIDGTHFGDFAISTLPATLAANGSTTFTVTLTPSAVGARSAALHITSDDPDESPFDINLTGSGLTPYQVAQQNAGIAGTADPNADTDGDGILNVMEIAFGTNPGSNGSGTGALQHTGGFGGGGTIVSMGQPIVEQQPAPNTVDVRAVFVRRKDAAALGLTYTVQFSADLVTWQSSTVTPTVLADDGTYQIVSVPYPFFVGKKKARFFRVTVSLAP